MRKTLKLFTVLCIALLACTMVFSACDSTPPTNSNETTPINENDVTTPESTTPEVTTPPASTEHVHAFTDWVVLKEANCSTEGEQMRMCACGTVEREIVAKADHVEVIEEAKAPTCTEDGYGEKRYCSVCGEVFAASDVVPALGHTEVVDEEPIAATCTKQGHTGSSHCSVCNEVLKEKEYTEVLGHSYDTSGECKRCRNKVYANISLPSTPKRIYSSTFGGDIESQITSISSSKTYNSKSNTFTCTFTMTVKVIEIDRGYSDYVNAKIAWRLLNSSGTILSSGTKYSPDLHFYGDEGTTFTITLTLQNIKPDTKYTLELFGG